LQGAGAAVLGLTYGGANHQARVKVECLHSPRGPPTWCAGRVFNCGNPQMTGAGRQGTNPPEVGVLIAARAPLAAGTGRRRGGVTDKRAGPLGPYLHICNGMPAAWRSVQRMTDEDLDREKAALEKSERLWKEFKERPTYVEYHGHCTRCHAELAGNPPAYIVKEKIELVTDGEHCFVYDYKWTPVCGQCLLPSEAESHRLKDHRCICEGCGLELLVTNNSVKVCSRACAQRASRKSKREKQNRCERCQKTFTSARRDARYCSNACRQWTYRCRAR
jgi:hypothetical protein